METVKMQYIGTEPTLVRTEPGGKKVEIEKGQTVDVEKGMAGELLRVYKGVWIEGGGKGGMKTMAKEVVEPEDVEGEVPEEKVAKGKPGRKKKEL